MTQGSGSGEKEKDTCGGIANGLHGEDNCMNGGVIFRDREHREFEWEEIRNSA